tara:strand:+ start:961 stop:2460 length:1500 start_codon:yes stop_codon:yes gene_type:complete
MNKKMKPIMVIGTSSGSGKSLISTALCRHFLRLGEKPIPFKAQNMSNNAWVDLHGGEMAYSQALQAWGAGVEPSCEMNPILLKPKGDLTSEVIHLGKSVGITNSLDYYKDWINPGWSSILKGLEIINSSYKKTRLIIEGAGSPVEVNLKHKDITNMRLACHLQADCILVADIERGGVFAQIVGTLELLEPNERALIKGIIINKFRGDISLFEDGVKWIESNTSIPVLGVLPWIDEIFPAEDSLDLIDRKQKIGDKDINITIIKLPSISNFSDIDPLEFESTVNVKWINPGERIGNPDLLLIPGSKQTLKDLKKLKDSGLVSQIKEYIKNGGNIFGICGGMQIMGHYLIDSNGIESNQLNQNKGKVLGLNIFPISTYFNKEKVLKRVKYESIWPSKSNISGFEIHHGRSTILDQNIKFIAKEKNAGYYKEISKDSFAAGTYIHGLFENGCWRRHFLNKLRERKKLSPLNTEIKDYKFERETIINILTNHFEKHINTISLR